MCGIAGTVGLQVDHTTVTQMMETMKRRGPDANGQFQKDHCLLLHSRLVIIDPDGGKQPMSLRFAGEDYTIVYNGELYNTAELRNLLCRLGHTFHSHSDTEVVLHAYAQWAEGCLERLNGIFAFAVWEHKKKKLFLARDRIGVKPLFYALHNECIIFASEIKTILAHPLMEARLDAQGVTELIMVGPGRVPGSGVFQGIRELEPGCFGCFCHGKWNWKRYWRLMDREHTDSFPETAAHVRYLVTDSIKRQMVSDVPIGTFLSGGLDSSFITSVCAQEMEGEGRRLQTFSVDYEHNDKYFVPGKFQPNRDNSYIQIMQEYLNTDHNWTVIDAQTLYQALEPATCARDLPGMADVDYSLLLFSEQIRSHVKVALSGECADEIFGGYPWYRDPEVRALNGFPWAQNTAQRVGLIHEEFLSQIDPVQFVGDLYSDTISKSDILPGTSPLERRMKQMVNLNHYWFMQTLLDRKDRMSMYCGLEVRVPFCDYRIAEYLYGVPWEMKDYQGQEKGLLRHAMKGYLPDEVLHRKKSPYPKTFDPLYAKFADDSLKELLEDPNAPLFQIVKRSAVEGLLHEEHLWPWYGQLMRRPQTVAYMLSINYWLKHYRVKLV